MSTGEQIARIEAFVCLADFCERKYDLFDKEDHRLKDIFVKHFNKRLRQRVPDRHEYSFVPVLEQDYWLRYNPGHFYHYFDDEVAEVWTHIEKVWRMQVRQKLTTGNEVSPAMPIYKLNFVAERCPSTHQQRVIWKAYCQKHTSYIIMDDSITEVLYRLNYVKQFENSIQQPCREEKSWYDNTYWLVLDGHSASTTGHGKHFLKDDQIDPAHCDFAIVSSPITPLRRRPLYLDNDKIHY